MTTGQLTKWHVADLSRISAYQLLLDVSTDSLFSKQKGGALDGAERHKLEVEIIEDDMAIKLLAKEGATLAVGTPIAVLCEDPAQLDKLAEEPDKLADALWQGYAAAT